MKIITNKFQPWAGAVDTYNIILENDCEADFDTMITELFPDGIDETQLNDLLWFEPEFIFEGLGIDIED